MNPYLADGLLLVAVLVLLAFNGYFVSAEFALVTVRWTRIEELALRGRVGAKAVKHALEHLDDAIATTQLGITFASLALGWLGEPALAHLVEPLFRGLPHLWGFVLNHALAVALAYLLLTFLHIVLGELAPKAIAIDRAEDLALILTGPLLVFGRIFRPFIRLMRVSSDRIVTLLRLPPLPAGQDVHSVQELGMLVEETAEAGMMATDQAEYVRNVFRLSGKRVRDVMLPREKVVTLPLTASQEEILETCRLTAHTRMPVWEGEPEHIVGIVNTKNLFHLFSQFRVVLLEDAMYPPIVAEPDQSVGRLLGIFRRERRPMAVVCDKQGKFMGIVTLEDILEEIVGEIEDEHDVPAHAAPPPAGPVTPWRLGSAVATGPLSAPGRPGGSIARVPVPPIPIHPPQPAGGSKPEPAPSPAPGPEPAPSPPSEPAGTSAGGPVPGPSDSHD